MKDREIESRFSALLPSAWLSTVIMCIYMIAPYYSWASDIFERLPLPHWAVLVALITMLGLFTWGDPPNKRQWLSTTVAFSTLLVGSLLLTTITDVAIIGIAFLFVLLPLSGLLCSIVYRKVSF